MAKLFISHADHDKALVSAFIDLLESGVGVPHGAIFCTSSKGQGIKPGADFKSSILESLVDADCVLALITEAYYASPFCLCELGGVWAVGKSFLPVIVSPLEYKDLKAVLAGLQASKITNDIDLDELRDELVERLKITPHSTPRWSTKKTKFLDDLPELINKTRFSGPVSREVYDKALKDLHEYHVEYDELQRICSSLEEKNQALMKVKDAKQVAKVIREHSSSIDVFEELAKSAKSAILPLNRLVREALYCKFRGKDFSPSRDDFEEAERLVEDGDFKVGSDDSSLVLNLKRAQIRKADEAIQELAEWLEEAPMEFFEWYEEEMDEEEPSISLRPFWDRHLC